MGTRTLSRPCLIFPVTLLPPQKTLSMKTRDTMTPVVAQIRTIQIRRYCRAMLRANSRKASS